MFREFQVWTGKHPTLPFRTSPDFFRGKLNEPFNDSISIKDDIPNFSQTIEQGLIWDVNNIDKYKSG